jgi:hypothetical protein
MSPMKSIFPAPADPPGDPGRPAAAFTGFFLAASCRAISSATAMNSACAFARASSAGNPPITNDSNRASCSTRRPAAFNIAKNARRFIRTPPAPTAPP